VAIGIRMTADEHISRDYGPLKNSTGVTLHKSSQNIEMRGSKYRQGLTARDLIRQPKRIKMYHFWTDTEKQILVEVLPSCTDNSSKGTIDWRRVYSVIYERFDWVQCMEISALKSMFYTSARGIYRGRKHLVQLAVV
jgi:hypothetical protein